MLKGILCPSKLSGTQLHPPSVLLNRLFKTSTWEGAVPANTGMCKRLPMASLVPCILASPVRPYFEGKGPATPPGLGVGAFQDFGLPWFLALKLPFEVPLSQAWNQHPLPVVPHRHGCALEHCSVLMSDWTTLGDLFEAPGPQPHSRSVSMQQPEQLQRR